MTGQSRTIPDRDGESSAQVSRHFQAFAQVVGSPGLSLARRRSPRARSALGPRWVRVATVPHGHQQSRAVTNGPEELQVASRPAQAAGMMRKGDSDCGPEGRGFESPRSPHSVPAAHWPSCHWGVGLDHPRLRFCERFLYCDLKAGPAGGRLRQPSSAGKTCTAVHAPRRTSALSLGKQVAPIYRPWHRRYGSKEEQCQERPLSA
jgi:hypothetical protein